MDSTDMTANLLLQRLHAVGVDDVLAVETSAEGMAAVAGLATRRSGTPVFVKTFAAPVADDLFAQEAEGLQALRLLGGLHPTSYMLPATFWCYRSYSRGHRHRRSGSASRMRWLRCI
jgi:hypothetical protein